MRRPVGDRQIVAQVGLIGPIVLQRVAPRDPREGPGDPVSAFVPKGDQHGLDVPEHIVHSDERGLEVDLRKLGLPVVAEVLVAKAAGDLEIAIEASHHQQLLVYLRRLRQRVELAGMHARGYEVVPRPFGCRLGEDRRLDLEKLEVGEGAARALEQTMAQDEIRLHLRAPQVEVPVLQPQLLGGQLVPFAARDRDRRGDGGAHDGEQRRLHLDVAGRELGVLHVGGSRRHLTRDLDHRLAGQPAGHPPYVLGRGRADRNLHDPSAVTQIDEDDPSKIPPPVYPAPQPYLLPHVLHAQLAATVRTPGCAADAVYKASASHSTR